MVAPSLAASTLGQVEPLLQVDLLSEAFYFLLLLAGIGLMVAEALAPGTHVFVLGVGVLSAGILGIVLAPLGIPAFLTALIVALGAIAMTGLTLWGYKRTAMANQESVAETTDSDSLRGQFGTVTEEVTTSGGQVKLDDGGFNPYYEARSRDGTIPEGTEVMVVDPGGGNVIEVEAVAGEDDIDRELARERASSEQSGTDAAAANEDGTAPGEDAVDESDFESDEA